MKSGVPLLRDRWRKALRILELADDGQLQLAHPKSNLDVYSYRVTTPGEFQGCKVRVFDDAGAFDYVDSVIDAAGFRLVDLQELYEWKEDKQLGGMAKKILAWKPSKAHLDTRWYWKFRDLTAQQVSALRYSEQHESVLLGEPIST